MMITAYAQQISGNLRSKVYDHGSWKVPGTPGVTQQGGWGRTGRGVEEAKERERVIDIHLGPGALLLLRPED